MYASSLPRSRRAVSMAALVPLVLLVAVGCSTDGPSPAPTTSARPAATPTPQPAGAIRELSKVSCAKKEGSWNFTATLRNTGDERSTYTVTVAIAKTDGGTVVGQKAIKKTLKPGGTASISAKKIYTGKEKAVSCVPLATKAKA